MEVLLAMNQMNSGKENYLNLMVVLVPGIEPEALGESQVF